MQERIQANPDIFEKIKIINVFNGLTITPINYNLIDLESEIYLLNSYDSDVKKYLPNAFVENLKEAKDKLLEYLKKTTFFDSILYCIRMENIPIGYISLNSPLSNTGLNNWSIDFWINKDYRKKGIMIASLHKTILHMKSMDILGVLMSISHDNYPSISLAQKLGFTIINNDRKNNGGLYALRLQER